MYCVPLGLHDGLRFGFGFGSNTQTLLQYFTLLLSPLFEFDNRSKENSKSHDRFPKSSHLLSSTKHLLQQMEAELVDTLRKQGWSIDEEVR